MLKDMKWVQQKGTEFADQWYLEGRTPQGTATTLIIAKMQGEGQWRVSFNKQIPHLAGSPSFNAVSFNQAAKISLDHLTQKMPGLPLVWTDGHAYKTVGTPASIPASPAQFIGSTGVSGMSVQPGLVPHDPTDKVESLINKLSNNAAKIAETLHDTMIEAAETALDKKSAEYGIPMPTPELSFGFKTHGIDDDALKAIQDSMKNVAAEATAPAPAVVVPRKTNVSGQSVPPKVSPPVDTKPVAAKVDLGNGRKSHFKYAKKEGEKMSSMQMFAEAFVHGGKVALADEGGNATLAIAETILGDMYPEISKTKEGKTFMKAFTALAVHYGVTQFPEMIPGGAENVQAACTMIAEAAGRDLLQPHLQKITPLIAQLAQVGASQLKA